MTSAPGAIEPVGSERSTGTGCVMSFGTKKADVEVKGLYTAAIKGDVRLVDAQNAGNEWSETLTLGR